MSGAKTVSRRIIEPPKQPATADGVRAGGWWHPADGQRAVCDVCPRQCALRPGDRGFCFVRQNLDGQVALTTYGRSTGFCVDPIEKKPLNQFYPGTPVLSFGTAGCNLGCKFCQNWSISKSREIDSLVSRAEPEAIAAAAAEIGCRSVAYTYNDPIIWLEYAIDTARACRAAGIQNVAVTSGYILPEARTALFSVMDAANVDLKAFTEDFYWRYTASHLQPVCDTLRWLVHESDVWVELTTLLIPQANDNDDDLRRMCDWIAGQLRPDVPLHFTAFHPDFRLTDRGPTPRETLNRAYDIARAAGLHYVYTGNVSDPRRQSTYCPGCDRLLIERAGYELGVYDLDGNRCRHCQATIAGRFDRAPGTWGGRRLPVQIKPLPRHGEKAMSVEGEGVSREVAQPPEVPAGRPALAPRQEQAILTAAARRVAATVRAGRAEPLEPLLGDCAGVPLLGAFVTLKRAGRLRSCCGFLGQEVPLGEALGHAAVRAAKDDPRFPPIAGDELEHLEFDVWLLWNLQPVAARGAARADAVVIGKHGLQISRGHARGLLLPGVAVDHKLDARGFLRQVCIKANLPEDAWTDDAATLATFEGHAIHGQLRDFLPPAEPAPPRGPTPADVAALADFCRGNVQALFCGATPSYYLPGGYDGGVHGVVLGAQSPAIARLECCKVSLRPDMPLQSTLHELCQALVQALRASGAAQQAIAQLRCSLAVFFDPVPHGPLAAPELAGLDPQRRAVLVEDGAHWALAHDPALDGAALLAAAAKRGQIATSGRANVWSLAAVATHAPLAVSNSPPAEAPAVRPPAVAGRFYPGSPQEIARALEALLPPQRNPQPWAGAMVPHAAWMYSGRVAAEVLSRVRFPSCAIIVCPKHHAGGADWAVAPHAAWSFPGGQVEGDPELAQHLADRVSGLTLDAIAHRAEHAIEVQLPILARLAPQTRVVGIAIRQGDYEELAERAGELAAALAELAQRPLLIVSTDMNHYADDAHTRRVDRMALDAIEALDPARLYHTVVEHEISMCGFRPAVLVMETLRRLGALRRCEPVAYATSGEVSGDRAHVVGYAGMLFG